MPRNPLSHKAFRRFPEGHKPVDDPRGVCYSRGARGQAREATRGDGHAHPGPGRHSGTRASELTYLKDKLDVASLGLEMGIAVAIGAVFGQWLDGRLGSDPWFTLLFIGCGVAAATKGVLRAIKAARRDMGATAPATPARSLVLPGDGGRWQ